MRLAVLALLLAGWVQPVVAQMAAVSILEAEFAEPTRRYGHDALGRGAEWGALAFELDLCPACAAMRRGHVDVRLEPNRVFEDTAPRLMDMNGDGSADAVVVVESDLALGSRLAIWSPSGFVAGTPFIGEPRRWLAVAGIADLDGDGSLEFAYVERPHIAPVLMVWQLRGREFVKIAELPGVSNHRFGEARIEGGVRVCGGVTELVLPDAGFANVMAVRLQGGALSARVIAPYDRPATIRAVLECRI